MGATTSPLSVHVALQAYAVFLSALLVHNAFNVLNKAAEQYEDYEKWRVEEVARVGNGSLFSAAHSVWPNYEYPSIRLEDGAPESTDYHKQPILMFMMHIGPALLWSLIAPLQLSAKARKMSPWVHRALGTIFLLCSATIGISTVLMYVLGVGIERENFITKWGIKAVGLWFLYTAAQAYYTAVTKRFNSHKEWIVRHTMVGYFVGLQRVMLLIAASIANVVELPAPYNSGNSLTWDLERQFFVVSAITAVVVQIGLAEWYLANARRGTATGEVKKTQ